MHMFDIANIQNQNRREVLKEQEATELPTVGSRYVPSNYPKLLVSSPVMTRFNVPFPRLQDTKPLRNAIGYDFLSKLSE